jgi:UDP-N-acetylglucosamine pyrophosphorylase
MDAFEEKLRADGRSDACVQSFRASYETLARGESADIAEGSIDPASDILYLEPATEADDGATAAAGAAAAPAPASTAVAAAAPPPAAPRGRRSSIREATTSDPTLLRQCVVVKLNGGLGTGMGLAKAKSLLEVKDGRTFLDLICSQVVAMRAKHGEASAGLRFMLMNSFSTSADTLAFVRAHYPSLAAEAGIEIVQNRVPKVDAATLRPATCAADPEKEWCPPGHGDLYATLARDYHLLSRLALTYTHDCTRFHSLFYLLQTRYATLSGSGRLAELLAAGVKYMFVSNSDNLGATLDLDLLTHFAQSGAPFLMEVCERTENDRKGGHLCVRRADGRLCLRESAQCAEEDKGAFQDIGRHRFFNTNNLWVRLDALDAQIAAGGGTIRLPTIQNRKTVDPQDARSAKVVQLETAMGAAIECFDGAGAAVVPRTRFAPVKTCADLLMLRSDAYVLGEDGRPVLADRAKPAPVVTLDPAHFKFVQQLEAATAQGVPSLAACARLSVAGPVAFAAGVVFQGSVEVVNRSAETRTVPAGVHTGTVDLLS